MFSRVNGKRNGSDSPRSKVGRACYHRRPQVVRGGDRRDGCSYQCHDGHRLRTKEGLTRTTPRRTTRGRTAPVRHDRRHQEDVVRLGNVRVSINSSTSFRSCVGRSDRRTRYRVARKPCAFFRLFSLLCPNSLSVKRERFRRRRCGREGGDRRYRRQGRRLIGLGILRERATRRSANRRVEDGHDSREVNKAACDRALGKLNALSVTDHRVEVCGRLRGNNQDPCRREARWRGRRPSESGVVSYVPVHFEGICYRVKENGRRAGSRGRRRRSARRYSFVSMFTGPQQTCPSAGQVDGRPKRDGRDDGDVFWPTRFQGGDFFREALGLDVNDHGRACGGRRRRRHSR